MEHFGWCIGRALSHPYNTDEVVQIWLKNEKVGEFLVTVTENYIQDEVTADVVLILKQSFTECNVKGNNS